MRFHSAIPIGSGGSGRVLRAFDPRRGHEVALKLLQTPNPASALRLQREARAQARLEHPNVARVFDSGVLEDGQPYIAMQLIEGRPLDEVAADLPLRERILLMLPVIDGVHAAHRLGLVHRDLKPSNILVERDADGRLHPWVLDFGLVQDRAEVPLTACGEMLGTPGYLSPEQASADAPVDARSDVFSLGVILYQLSCGRQPFAADSVAATIARLLRHEPPPPQRVDPGVPAALGRIILQCLEKDPARRYPSARALHDDLQAFLDGRPLAARRYGPVQRGWRWLRASPARLAALAMALALPPIAGGLWAWQSFERYRQVAQAQAFTATALDIAAEMRLAMLWPGQDLARHRARLRPLLQPLERAYASADPAVRMVAAEPLMRALAALGKREALLEVSAETWDQGLRTPMLAALGGQALAAEYQDGLATLAGIADPERRSRRAADLRTRWLVPALDRLRLAADDPGPEGQFAQALLEHHQGDDAAALARLAAWPTPTPESVRLGAQLRLQMVLRLADAGDVAELAAALDQADAAWREYADLARSDPAAWSARCHLESLRLRMHSRVGEEAVVALPDELPACDRAAGYDSDDARLPVQRAQAYAALARRAVMLGASPLPALARLREGVPEQPPPAIALALAEALISSSEYLRWRGGEADAPLAEAGDLLEAAMVRAPGDVGIALGLGQALQLQALHAGGARAEPLYQRAADVLERALAAEDTLSTRLRLAELLTWWAQTRLLELREPGAELTRAIALLEAVLSEHPQDLRLLQRLAFARWTAGQHLAATGGDATEELSNAEAIYDHVLALDPGRAGSRFNRLSVQYTLARHQLQRGDSAAAVLARVLAGMPSLAASVEPGLAIQVGAWRLLHARELSRSHASDPRHWTDARAALLVAMALPADRASAAMQLADLWVHRPDAARHPADLAADLDRIDAVLAIPDAPRLLALHRARMLARAARLEPARYAGLAAAARAPFDDTPWLRPYAAELSER